MAERAARELRSPELILTVDGVRYGGWQRARIVRNMDSLAGAFEFTVHERWPGQDAARPIRPGAACTVAVEGETILTGYVDDVGIGYDAQSHEVRVAGRDKTLDLIDSAALPLFSGIGAASTPEQIAHEVTPNDFYGQSLEQVAKTLCEPYGITVAISLTGRTVADDAAIVTEVARPYRNYRVTDDETVFAVLERGARYRGVLLTSDGLGNLVITRASRERLATALVRGRNILACDAEFSWRERFQHYIVKGYAIGPSEGRAPFNGAVMGSAFDEEIDRLRIRSSFENAALDPAACTLFAEFERNVRFGRGQRITYTVPGWSHRDGLWSPNIRVAVQDDWLGIDHDLLLAGVTLLLDAQGSRAELTLYPPETFERMPLPEPLLGH